MIAFFLASIFVEITPGPNMATLAALALARGRNAGLMAVAGVTAGLTVIGLAATLGLAALLASAPLAYETLRWGGAAFLVYLAWDMCRGPGDGETSPADGRPFWQGFVTNVLNPKAAIFYVAILPGFVDPTAGSVLGHTLALVAVHVVIATTIHAGIVLGAAKLRPVLAESFGLVVVRRGLALGLVGVAVWLLVGTAR